MESILSKEMILQLKGFITPTCFENLFVKFAFFQNEMACEKLLLSKCLGLAIVAGSLFLKTPQIFNILRAKSARGLSVLMFTLEMFMFTCTLAYNYRQNLPFNTYGEYAFMTVQSVILYLCIFFYNNDLGAKFFGITALFAAFFYGTMTEAIPFEVLSQMYVAQMGVFIIARMPQIISNYKNQGSGELSFLMMLLSAGGSLARVFTTIQETNDPLMLASFLLGTFLNFVIVFQILYYGKGKGPTSASKAKKTKKTQ